MDDASFPLVDVVDHEILMHRDAHFGGLFSEMIAYYKKQGKGVHPHFELKRLRALEQAERTGKYNLSDTILGSSEKQEIARSRALYASLRDLYTTQPPSSLACLIADLVLSEKSHPQQEIDAIVAYGKGAVQSLIDLLNNDDLYNPIFPGYGLAPAYIAHCLGRLGDERAIIPLFETLKKEDFFLEEALLDALRLLGDKAKGFLLKALTRLPISRDNECAVIALISMEEDPEIAHHCFHMLETHRPFSRPYFSTYLILGCSALKDPQERQKFLYLSNDPAISSEWRQEMHQVVKSWKS